jgi:hypothetical protein
MKSKENSPIAYNPPTGIRAKLPTKVNRYFDYSKRKQGLVVNPEEEKKILTNPESHGIIRNDGSSTFVVHSTSKDVANDVLQHGLGLNAQYYDTGAPDLFETAKMLAVKDEKAADSRNVHGLAYRYDGGDYGEGTGYKVVAELAIPNPGTSLNTNPFLGTALERPDGVNLLAHDTEDTGHGKPYSIPPERIRGYFNVETGEFAYNERFIEVATVVGQAAVDQQLG